MKKKKIFLICPVRNFDEEEQKKIEEYVKNLENQGHEVYWPIRDTNQDDPIGIEICTDNGWAIIWADEIHIWWQPESEGSKFDFGMSFLCYILDDKKIILANPDDVKRTTGKSFENVLLTLHFMNTEGGKE